MFLDAAGILLRLVSCLDFTFLAEAVRSLDGMSLTFCFLCRSISLPLASYGSDLRSDFQMGKCLSSVSESPCECITGLEKRQHKY